MRRYIFKYTPEPTRTGIIHRPTARILLQSTKNEWYAFRVYIDSGADISLFTKTDAKLLGLDLYKGEYRPIIGIGKTLIPAYTHKVKMKIEETTLNVNASFADSDEVPRLLGRTDIFKHFKIIFNEQNLEVIFESP
ncbi:MAG: retroviral-like aspartic protease family protein [Candidatus Bathyarchaeota archaeon]|nr:retroviral-like aspartic protease family protein [Candidatus Bathyarchaeota archaeon]